MRKIFIILTLVSFCGGSSANVVVEDTTTTIPEAPELDIDILNIYTSKLKNEPCGNSINIETTSEECLRIYQDNLIFISQYTETVGDYKLKLNSYINNYPEQATEEYMELLRFINDDFEAVNGILTAVNDKYIERFGGIPVVELSREIESFESGCKMLSTISAQENIQKLELTYLNEFDEEFKLIFFKFNNEIEKYINAFSGNFELIEAVGTNYLNEEYKLDLKDSFKVTNALPRVTSIEVINGTPDLSIDEFTTVEISYLPGTYYDYFEEVFIGLYDIKTNSSGPTASFYQYSDSSSASGGVINKNKGVIRLNLIFSDTRIPKNDEWASTLPKGPYQKNYYIGTYNLFVGGNSMFAHYNKDNFSTYFELQTACGIKDDIKTTGYFINNEINVNP